MPPLNMSVDQSEIKETPGHIDASTHPSCFTTASFSDAEVSENDTCLSNQAPLFLKLSPDLSLPNSSKKKPSKKSNSYKVNGVNILNRKSIDGKAVMERLKKRRENHNHVERKRRDNINHTILEISQLIPQETAVSTKLNKGNILRMAAEYIKELQLENHQLKSQLGTYNDKQSVYLGVETNPHPINRLPHTEMIKVESSNYSNPAAFASYSEIGHLTNGPPRYQVQQQQLSTTPPTANLPLPSITQFTGHLSPRPDLSSHSSYHPAYHRGLMLTDYHNTLNLL